MRLCFASNSLLAAEIEEIHSKQPESENTREGHGVPCPYAYLGTSITRRALSYQKFDYVEQRTTLIPSGGYGSLLRACGVSIIGIQPTTG